MIFLGAIVGVSLGAWAQEPVQSAQPAQQTQAQQVEEHSASQASEEFHSEYIPVFKLNLLISSIWLSNKLFASCSIFSDPKYF